MEMFKKILNFPNISLRCTKQTNGKKNSETLRNRRKTSEITFEQYGEQNQVSSVTPATRIAVVLETNEIKEAKSRRI